MKSAAEYPSLQLRNLGKKIFNSPVLKADLGAACTTSKIKQVQMVRDVATRWNSTAELVGCAIQLRKALSLLVIDKEHNKLRGVRLKRFQLSSREWELLEQLYPLLDVCPCFFNEFVGLFNLGIGLPCRDKEDISKSSSAHPGRDPHI
jgi:hypothetical protein